MLFQPGQIEHFTAGTLRAFGHEERVAEHCFEQGWLNLAGRSPLPAPVIVFAALPVNPGIHQHISRATVETGYRFVRLNQAEIAESAYIQDRLVTGTLFK